MSYLDETGSGKRENAYYVKTGVRRAGSYFEDRPNMPRKVYVYEWDEREQRHIGHLMDSSQYYS